MSIIWTNWKLVQLWGKRSLSIAVMMLVFLVAFGAGEGSLFFLFCLTVACPFSGVHSYVGARSFSFCLPGYRGMLRKMVLTDAVLGGVAFAVFGALVPGERIWPLVGLNAFAGFFVGFVFFLLIATLALVPSVMAPAVEMLLSIPSSIAVLVALGVIVLCPWLFWPILILMCIAVSLFVWIRLCDAQDVTHAHRTMIVDRLRQKLGQMGEAKVSSPWVDRLFLGRMTGPGFLQAGRWFWGSLYRTFGLVLSAWKGILVAIIGGTVLLGYAGETTQWQALVALGLAALKVKLPIVSNMLLPEGRREKQRAVVGAAAVTIALLVGIASLVVVLSWCLAPIMPHPFGRAYVGVNPRNIYLASVVIPWILLLQPIHYGVRSLVWKNVLRVTAILMVVTAFSDPQVCRWMGIARPVFFGIIFVLGWVFFLTLLRHVYLRGHLTT